MTNMARNVADVLWEMLANAGVRRCYGIVGDALNPVIDALRRNGKIEFVHVRNEEYGVFAAVAEAYFTGVPVVVCGTAGPGVVHLFNGLMDARKEGAAVIAIAGDVETMLMDSDTLEELNPYKFFEAASLYTGRLVNPAQARTIINTAILTAVIEKGPTVISIPGDVASADAAEHSVEITIPTRPIFRPSDSDLSRLVKMIDDADTVAIFGGEGCRDAHDEVIQLAGRLKAPVGYSFRGNQWLEHDNSNAVGMTGLLGYGGAYGANNGADLLLMLGTDFPFSEFLPGARVKKVQIDKNPKHIGRRTPVDLGLVGDIKTTVTALLESVREKTDDSFLRKHIADTDSFSELLQHYVDKGPGIKPIRPEFLAATLSDLASDDAMFFADTGTACIWLARHIKGGRDRRLFGSFSWASMANAAANAFGAQLAYPGRQTIAICGDGGFTMLGDGRPVDPGGAKDSRGPYHTQQRIIGFREHRAARSRLHSFWREIQESQFRRRSRSDGRKRYPHRGARRRPWTVLLRPLQTNAAPSWSMPLLILLPWHSHRTFLSTRLRATPLALANRC